MIKVVHLFCSWTFNASQLPLSRGSWHRKTERGG